jgi:hypothetical protein
VKYLFVLAFALPLLASVGSASPGVVGSRTLATRAPIGAIAADGKLRAALVVHVGCRAAVGVCSATEHLCAVVEVWEPVRGRDSRIERTCPSDFVPSTGGIALAGKRVGWLQTFFGSTDTETVVKTATLARRKPVTVAYALGSAYGHYGDTTLAPVGDGGLLAFTVERRCAEQGEDGPPCPTGRKPHDVIAATIWRVPGRGRCPADSVVHRCARVAKAAGELTVLAVDAGRIVARTDDGVSLLTSNGVHVRDFPVAKVRAGVLSGSRLALRVTGAVEIFDTGSGELVKSLPMRLDRLEDIDHGILVTATKRTVTLRRLSDGHTARIHTRAIPHAQLEPSGLFVAGGHRVTFLPMADILRRLG